MRPLQHSIMANRINPKRLSLAMFPSSRRRAFCAVCLAVANASLTTQKLYVSTVDSAPYAYKDAATGQHQGILLDMWSSLVNKASGKGDTINYEISHDPHTGSYSKTLADLTNLSHPTNVVLADLFLSSSRLDDGVAFPLPFGIYEWALVKSRKLSLTALKTLEGVNSSQRVWKVCTVADTIHSVMKSKYSKIDWLLLPNDPGVSKSHIKKGLDHLVAQECELALLNREGTQWVLQDDGSVDSASAKYKHDDFVIMPQTINSQPIQIAASSTAISTELSKYIHEMYQENTLSRLFSKYLGGSMKGLHVYETQRNVLDGYHFDVIAVPDAPYVIYSAAKRGNDRFQGFCPDILRQMAASGKFTFTFHLPSDATANETGSYKVAAQDVENAAVIGDMYLGGFFVTEDRLNRFAVMTAFQDVGLNFLYLTEKKEFDMFAFRLPFDDDLWFAILAVVVLSGIMMWFLEASMGNTNNQLVGHSGRTMRGLKANIIPTTYLSFGTCSTYLNHTPQTYGGQVFSVMYLFFCTLVVSTYTANLATILVETASQTTTQTMTSLAAEGAQVCIREKTAYGSAMKRDWDGKLSFLELPSNEHMVAAVLAKQCKAAINQEYMVVVGRNSDCEKLSIGAQPFWDHHSVSWGMNKASLRQAQAMSVELARLIEPQKGSDKSWLEDASKKYFDPSFCGQQNAETSVDAMKIGIKHMYLPIMTMGAVVVIAYVVEMLDQHMSNLRLQAALSGQYQNVIKQDEGGEPYVDFDAFWELADYDESKQVRVGRMKILIIAVYKRLHNNELISLKELDRLLKQLDVDFDGYVEKDIYDKSENRRALAKAFLQSESQVSFLAKVGTVTTQSIAKAGAVTTQSIAKAGDATVTAMTNIAGNKVQPIDGPNVPQPVE